MYAIRSYYVKSYYFSVKQSENDFTCMDWDKNGNCWCATVDKNGLFLFEDGKFTYLEDTLNTTKNFGEKLLTIDEDNNFWYSNYGVGFAKFDPQSKVFSYFPINKEESGTNGKFITDLENVNDSILMIAIDQGGINILNKRNNTFEYITYDNPGYGELLRITSYNVCYTKLLRNLN